MCKVFENFLNEYYKNQLKFYSREDIGRTLKFYRIYKGFSQKTLARALNTNFQKIQKLENGKYRMTPEKLMNICNVLNVNINQFLNSIVNCDLLLEILEKN